MTQVYTHEELEKRKAWLRNAYPDTRTGPKPHWYERELRYLATIQALQQQHAPPPPATVDRCGSYCSGCSRCM